MTYSEVLELDKSTGYQLLGRLESDCKYYLGYGYKNKEDLWAHSERKQIEYMFLLYNYTPDWISLNDINNYAKQMGVNEFTHIEFVGKWIRNSITFAIYRKWGDKEKDRLECYTYPLNDVKKEKFFLRSKRYINPLDFVLYCQANFKYN